MISIDPERDAFGVIDVQPDFMPGGALATPDGGAVVRPINRLLVGRFGFKFATQDWHPHGNITFASRHPGKRPLEEIETNHGRLTLWPDHAIQGTKMAELHADLDAARFDMILRKGAGGDLEGFSAFSNLIGRGLPTGLAAMLKAQGIQRLFLAGLALDVCVAATAEDATVEGFETHIVEDACRASKTLEVPVLTSRLTERGIRFVQEADLHT